MKLSQKKQKNIIIFLCVGIILTLLFYVEHLERNPIIKEVAVEKQVTVEVEVEKEVVSEVYIEVAPKTHYNVTNVEREMIARLLFREAGAASLECQKMVVSVIFNRYDAAEGTTINDIINARNQFTPAKILYRTTPTERNYEAVDYVIKNGSVLPSYVRFFRADYHFNWSGYVGYTSLDGTYFGYLTRDKNG